MAMAMAMEMKMTMTMTQHQQSIISRQYLQNNPPPRRRLRLYCHGKTWHPFALDLNGRMLLQLEWRVVARALRQKPTRDGWHHI